VRLPVEGKVVMYLGGAAVRRVARAGHHQGEAGGSSEADLSADESMHDHEVHGNTGTNGNMPMPMVSSYSENLSKTFDPIFLYQFKYNFLDNLLSLIEEAIKVDTIIRDITVFQALKYIKLAHQNNILRPQDKARLRICLDDLESTLRLYER